MPADPATRPPAADRFRPPTPLVIGLVGGIAAGKSAVATAFAARGLHRIDADEHARAAALEPAVCAELAATFGEGVLRDGRPDRAALARLVFADAGARQRLEAILHPRIRARILAELDAARDAGHSVLLDAPLLLEGGLVAWCDRVVFVDAPLALRQARAQGRGWDDGELARREAAQLPLDQKRARASAVIDNGRDLAHVTAQVDALLQRWSASSP
jgi:dephospho-CoA kinase